MDRNEATSTTESRKEWLKILSENRRSVKEREFKEKVTFWKKFAYQDMDDVMSDYRSSEECMDDLIEYCATHHEQLKKTSTNRCYIFIEFGTDFEQVVHYLNKKEIKIKKKLFKSILFLYFQREKKDEDEIYLANLCENFIEKPPKKEVDNNSYLDSCHLKNIIFWLLVCSTTFFIVPLCKLSEPIFYWIGEKTSNQSFSSIIIVIPVSVIIFPFIIIRLIYQCYKKALKNKNNIVLIIFFVPGGIVYFTHLYCLWISEEIEKCLFVEETEKIDKITKKESNVSPSKEARPPTFF